jgi:hypothetical protein
MLSKKTNIVSTDTENLLRQAKFANERQKAAMELQNSAISSALSPIKPRPTSCPAFAGKSLQTLYQNKDFANGKGDVWFEDIDGNGKKDKITGVLFDVSLGTAISKSSLIFPYDQRVDYAMYVQLDGDKKRSAIIAKLKGESHEQFTYYNREKEHQERQELQERQERQKRNRAYKY